MKILILGLDGVGKTTLGKKLAGLLKLKFEDATDYMANKIIFPALREEYNNDYEAMMKDKSNRRIDWYNIVNYTLATKEDKFDYIKEFLETSDIYCGMRDQDMVMETEMLFDYIIVLSNPKISDLEFGYIEDVEDIKDRYGYDVDLTPISHRLYHMEAYVNEDIVVRDKDFRFDINSTRNNNSVAKFIYEVMLKQMGDTDYLGE